MDPITFDDDDDLASELGLTGEPPASAAKKSEPERPIWEEPKHILTLPPRQQFTELLKLAGRMDDDFNAFQKARRADYVAKVEALWRKVKGPRKKFVLSTAEIEFRTAIEDYLATGKAAIEAYKVAYKQGVDRLCDLLTLAANEIEVPGTPTAVYLTTVSQLSYNSQVQSDLYARVRAELYAYDVEAMKLRAEIKRTETGKLSQYDVWVFCSEDDLTILRRKSGASMQDLCAEAWARGCNPQVFWPLLPQALYDAALADGMRRKQAREAASPLAAAVEAARNPIPEPIPEVDLGEDGPADEGEPEPREDYAFDHEEEITVDGPPRTTAELAEAFDATTQPSLREPVHIPEDVPAEAVPEPDPFDQFMPPSDQATTPLSDGASDGAGGGGVPW